MNSPGATVSKNNFCSIYELERLKGAKGFDVPTMEE